MFSLPNEEPILENILGKILLDENIVSAIPFGKSIIIPRLWSMLNYLVPVIYYCIVTITLITISTFPTNLILVILIWLNASLITYLINYSSLNFGFSLEDIFKLLRNTKFTVIISVLTILTSFFAEKYTIASLILILIIIVTVFILLLTRKTTDIGTFSYRFQRSIAENIINYLSIIRQANKARWIYVTTPIVLVGSLISLLSDDLWIIISSLSLLRLLLILIFVMLTTAIIAANKVDETVSLLIDEIFSTHSTSRKSIVNVSFKNIVNHLSSKSQNNPSIRMRIFEELQILEEKSNWRLSTPDAENARIILIHEYKSRARITLLVSFIFTIFFSFIFTTLFIILILPEEVLSNWISLEANSKYGSFLLGLSTNRSLIDEIISTIDYLYSSNLNILIEILSEPVSKLSLITSSIFVSLSLLNTAGKRSDLMKQMNVTNEKIVDQLCLIICYSWCIESNYQSFTNLVVRINLNKYAWFYCSLPIIIIPTPTSNSLYASISRKFLNLHGWWGGRTNISSSFPGIIFIAKQQLMNYIITSSMNANATFEEVLGSFNYNFATKQPFSYWTYKDNELHEFYTTNDLIQFVRSSDIIEFMDIKDIKDVE